MSNATISSSVEILLAISKLPHAEQLALHRDFTATLNRNLKAQHVAKAAAAANTFVPGQIVSWYSNKRSNPGTKFMKIEKFNRAGTAAVGPLTDRDGNVIPGGARWTVATTLLKAI